MVRFLHDHRAGATALKLVVASLGLTTLTPGLLSMADDFPHHEVAGHPVTRSQTRRLQEEEEKAFLGRRREEILVVDSKCLERGWNHTTRIG